MSKIYLLDSNTLIDAKNRYYDMEICPGFWDFIDKKFSETYLYSIQSIYDELIRGDVTDELTKWSKVRKDTGFFLDNFDTTTQENYAQIVTYVNAHTGYSPQQKVRFLSEADPWIIAKAKTLNAVVVTNETLVVAHSKKVKIPNICKEFSVEYISSFNLLKELKAEFILK